MQIKAVQGDFFKVLSDAIIVGINESADFHPIIQQLDEKTNQFLTKQKKAKRLPQKTGEIRIFYDVLGIESKSIVVACFKQTAKDLTQINKQLLQFVKKHQLKSVINTIVFSDISGFDLEKKAAFISQAIIDADYICDDYKSEKTEKYKVEILLPITNDEESIKINQGIKKGVAIGHGMNKLKHLGDSPGNVCTPNYLVQKAKEIADEHKKIDLTVLEEKEIKTLQMGALISVAKGSVEAPKLIVIEYKGSSDAPIVLVGKGVTFDSGGISLKPGPSMDEMKYDMCGAGSVIGTIQAIAEMELPIHVIGVIPAVENMPSGQASKPGDIVHSMSGKTIEVLNTDAEGRLILCDALTYAKKFKPKTIIDIATLTGAVIIALGKNPSGMMSNDDNLAAELIQAGQSSNDRVWQLPIWEEYVQQLESPFADLQNIGGREAGTITAGCFLAEFVKEEKWAHLDIAGTAWVSGKNKGATGRPVPLLVEYLCNQVK